MKLAAGRYLIGKHALNIAESLWKPLTLGLLL